MQSRLARSQRGYSLYELLVTLTLTALVLVVGIPSFSGTIARNRISVEINALFHAMHVARKESIMRRQVVSICPSSSGVDCEPGRDWSNGWIMFTNHDRDQPPQVDPNETVIQIHQVTKNVRITANRLGFTLRATQQRATNGTIVVCDLADRAPPKALVVSYTGRPRVTLKDTRGRAYKCSDLNRPD
jgi:type IV fimbrial biogenesis protein FimT